MAGVLQHLRSSTLNKRPNPASMVDGQLAINYASGSPGAFFKDSNGNLVKVGPVHVGATAPNVSPASGGTAGNSLGEQWLDTSGGTYVFKIWDGAAWRSEAGEFVNVTGDTMTGALGIIAGSASTPGLFFSGDANSGLYSPGADQVAISTGGSGRLFVDASGRVGVGTSAPSNTLHVNSGAVGTSTLLESTGSGSYLAIKNSSGQWTLGATTTSFILENSGGTALTVDSSRRLLVGTSSSRQISGNTAQIQLEGTDTNNSAFSITTNSNNNQCGYLVFGKSRGTAIGGTTVVQADDFLGRIDFAGANGSNVTNIAALIAAQVDGAVSGGGANDMPGRLVFSTTADGASSPTPRMVIKNTGLVGIGITDPTNSFSNGNGVQFDPVGVVYANRSSAPSASFGRNTSTGDVLGFFYGSTATNASQVGSISVTGSATAYNTSSDYRLKENVVAVTDGIARLQQLKPSRFNFISDPDTTVDGFIAHEVQAIVPEAIRGVKDEVDAEGNPVYQGIDQSKLVPLLTAALQEAVAKIESLEARLTAAGI